MRKFLIVFIALMLLLTATLTFAKRPKFETKIGTVKRMKISIFMQGSHMLVNGERLICLLESHKYNLCDYEGLKVKVSGPLEPTVEGGQEIMDVKRIDVLGKR